MQDRLQTTGRLTSLATMIALLISLPNVANADKSLLVHATVNGRESSLYEKVVVTGSAAQIRKAPGGSGDFIEPFAIFYKLYTDSRKTESNGHYRVGKSDGTPLGWIKKEDVRPWNTRFVLEPLDPIPGRTFSVELADGLRADLQIVPGGKRRFAFITSSASKDGEGNDENGPFPVIICTAEVRSEGSRSFTDELNDLKDMKLEIVFVIESTDFMLNVHDGRQLKDYVVDLGNSLAGAVKGDKNLSDTSGIRFGVVEYQDTSKLADYVARVTLPLTGDMASFTSSLRRLNPKAIEGDWPEDVLAGLYAALQNAGWSSNSSKHIVHIGKGSFQLSPKGSGPNQYGGDWNPLTAKWSRSRRTADLGHNSTGLSIQRLIQLANPEGGTVEQKARNQKSFHSLWIGESIEDLLGPLLVDGDLTVAKALEFAEQVTKYDEATLKGLIASGTLKISTISLLLRIYLQKHQQELAKQQYRELVRNRGTDGYFAQVEPKDEAVKKAAAELTAMVSSAVAVMSKVRMGEIATADELDGSNPIVQRYYVIVGAAAERLSDTPVLTGTAAIRDSRGRLVAQKKILVTKEELIRLKSTFQFLQNTFEAKTAKVDRQDVSKILDTLKRAIAGTAAGQKLDASVQLKSLITDLPLKTNALDVTPGDIAVMSTDAFTQWMNRLEASRLRIEDLLEGKAQWLELNAKAQNDKFTFLHLSELP